MGVAAPAPYSRSPQISLRPQWTSTAIGHVAGHATAVPSRCIRVPVYLQARERGGPSSGTADPAFDLPCEGRPNSKPSNPGLPAPVRWGSAINIA